MSNFDEFKHDINRTSVSPELLGEVIEMYTGLALEERDFEARAIRVVKFLTERGYGRNCGLIAATIIIRLMALDAILADKQVQGWSLPGTEPGETYVHFALLKAAAQETVVAGSSGQPIFDAANFRQRVLQVAGTGGAHEANGAAITMFCPALNARLGSGTCLHQPTAPFGAIKPKPALPHANLHT